MNKKVIYIGLGLLAIGGLAYYFFMKPSSSSTSTDTSGDGTREADDYTDIPSTDASSGMPTTRKERRQDRRQNRRDCRAEAKAQGLSGKAKRDYRKACKAAGGIDDGMDSFDGMFE